MKNIFILFLSIAFISCNTSQEKIQEDVVATDSTTNLEYFGEEITPEDAVLATNFFNEFSEGDSIQLKLEGEVTSVCQKKGCWMKMGIGNDEDEIMIRFKDYGFFVPLNCEGRTAVIEGWAYKEELSVDELKHYAFDAGKTDEEIDAITEPEINYTFMAYGVILK